MPFLREKKGEENFEMRNLRFENCKIYACDEVQKALNKSDYRLKRSKHDGN